MSNEFLSRGFQKKGVHNTLSEMVGGPGITSTTTEVRSVGTSPTLKSVSFRHPGGIDKIVTDLISHSIEWALLDYVEGNQISVTKQGKGATCVPPPDVQNDLDDNKVQYLLVAMSGNQYFFFTWIGTKAPSQAQKASDTHKKELHAYLAQLFQKNGKVQLQSGELRC